MHVVFLLYLLFKRSVELWDSRRISL